jgi:hypothetical protein
MTETTENLLLTAAATAAILLAILIFLGVGALAAMVFI